MNLFQKTLLAIGLTIFTLVVMLFFFWRDILLDSYASFEQIDTSHNVERAVNALRDYNSTIGNHLNDWAAWDATYRFMVHQEPHYLADNIVGPETLRDLKIHLTAYIQPDGRMEYSVAIDPNKANGGYVPLPASVRGHLKATDMLVVHRTNFSKVTGLLLVPEGMLMVASQPIVKGTHEGPIRGALVWGAFLTEAEVKRLSDLVHLPLSVFRVDQPTLPPDVVAAMKSLSMPGAASVLVKPLDAAGADVAGYTLLKDIYDKPALVMRVSTPRTIYAQGQHTVRQSLGLLIGTGVLFGLLNMLMLRFIVLGRLSRLSEDVGEIGTSGALSARVVEDGHDELSSLARAVNGMLGKLQASQAAILELEAWRKGEQRYTELMDVTPTMVLIVVDGRVAYANPVAARTLGFKHPDAMTGCSLSDWVTDEHRERLVEASARLSTRQQDILRLETRLVRQDGVVLDIELAANLMTFRDHISLQVIAQDVTETNKAQDALARMGQEMEIATRIQTALVPTETPITDFDLTMALITATEVGGDLIDYMPDPSGCFWLAIGDVTGHGLTPGLVMMMAQSMITGYILDNPTADPSKHLIRLNHALYQNVKHRLRNDNYMTLQLIRHAGDGRFIAAGMHCDMLIYRAASRTVERIEVPGFWTGLMPDVTHCTVDYGFELGPEDILLLYSDGLIEASNNLDEQYDMDRLELALIRYAHLSVEEIKRKVLEEVQAWLMEQLDDISIIVLRRHGSAVPIEVAVAPGAAAPTPGLAATPAHGGAGEKT